MTHDQKEKSLEARKEFGTLKSAANAASVTLKDLHKELRRSVVFKKRMDEAGEEGHQNMADSALQTIKDYAEGNTVKTDRNRLLAAIAIANAWEKGFKTQRVEQTVSGEVRIITAIPRPKYLPERKQLPKETVIEGEAREIE